MATTKGGSGRAGFEVEAEEDEEVEVEEFRGGGEKAPEATQEE